MLTSTNVLKLISRLFFISILIFLLGYSPLFAEKTDAVVLVNGDRITGDIKKLERGKLEFKTDDMGSVYIDWTKITKITSNAATAIPNK